MDRLNRATVFDDKKMAWTLGSRRVRNLHQGRFITYDGSEYETAKDGSIRLIKRF